MTPIPFGARLRLASLPLVTLLLAGCASMPSWMPFGSSHALRERADRLALEGRYSDAVEAYDEFLARYPDDGTAPRVRVSRGAAAGVLATRNEVERLRREVAMLQQTLQETVAMRDREQARTQEAGAEVTQLKAELTARQAELTARQAELTARQAELTARQAEVTRLNAELERLRRDLEELKRVDLRAPRH